MTTRWHFFFLYFFEGAPIGLLWWALPTLLASQGVRIEVITGLTAMAALPWTFKFLLGPVVDRFFLIVRDYALAVAAFQFLMLLALVGLVLTPLNSPVFYALTFLISLSGAVQDVFIDAWAIGSVADNERGQVNGSMQAGLLTGRWIFGAGLLILLSRIDWQWAVGLLIVLLLFSICYLLIFFRLNRGCINMKVGSLNFKSFNFLLSRKFIVLALVAIFSGFAFESLGAVAGPYLLAHDFPKEQVGWILSATLLSMLVGALIGGKWADQKNSRQVFLGAGIGLSVVVAITGTLSGAVALIVAYLICYFLIGVFTASSYAFYMENSKGSFEATRFTFLMAMTNLCESASAFTLGRTVASATGGDLPADLHGYLHSDLHGYSLGFLATSMISLLGLFLLWKFFISDSQNEFRNVD